MRRTVAAAFGVVILLAASVVSAKGPTAKITIEGSNLTAPIDIRDPAIEQFQIWAGPGTGRNGVEGTEGFIVDWSSTVEAEQLGRLQRYQVSFYAKEWNRRTQTYGGERLAYVVSYVYDAASGYGYVYLPGRRDREYQANAFSIYRGPRWEGRWFRATPAWQIWVTPLLANAQRQE